MAKESILQIRIDSDLKEAAEALYRGMGTSLPEAVRIFARQSIIAEGMPFALRSPARRKPSLFGVLGKYSIPHPFQPAGLLTRSAQEAAKYHPLALVFHDGDCLLAEEV